MRHSTHQTIYFNRLEHNLDVVRKACPGNSVMFMVKANGYGHGMTEVSSFAHEECGITEFGVATLGEGLELVRRLPDKMIEVSLFSDFSLYDEDSRKLISDHALLPVISSEEQLEIFLGASCFNGMPLNLKYNTGMNRLGLDPEKIEEHLGRIKRSGRKSIGHLMTHLACAGQSVHKVAKNKKQNESFQEIKSIFKSTGLELEKTSISNSGAIEQGFGLEESHVRPGLMIYGSTSLVPTLREKYPFSGKNISNLTAEVLRIFDGKKGDPVGYGATPLPESGKMILLSLGYGDGWVTGMKGATVTIDGKKGKLVGRINMDMCQVLFEGKTGSSFREGQTVTVWNENSSLIDELSDQTGIIPYELYTNLSIRVPKRYRISEEL